MMKYTYDGGSCEQAKSQVTRDQGEYIRTNPVSHYLWRRNYLLLEEKGFVQSQNTYRRMIQEIFPCSSSN